MGVKKATIKQVTKDDVKKVREAIEKHRKEKRHEHFEALTDEQIEEKLKRVNTPFLNSFGYSPTVPPGGSFGFSVGVFNPDPVTISEMYVYAYIGAGIAVPDNGIALLAVDERWNRLAGPAPFGLSLPSGGSGSVSLTIKAPSTIEKSSYFNTVVLIRRQFFDPSQVLDRGGFVFAVT